jgi:hypothetical protein
MQYDSSDNKKVYKLENFLKNLIILWATEMTGKVSEQWSTSLVLKDEEEFAGE